MNKDTFAVIQEIKHHRNGFMKKSTPYRQLTRAIKQLEKMEKVEQIVKAYDGSQASMIKQFTEIQEVLEEE